MKKFNVFKTVTLVMLLTIFLTWVLPGSSQQAAMTQTQDIRVGLFQLLNYSVGSASFFGWMALYLFAIGGFYAVLHKTGAYGLLIEQLIKKVKKGKEWILLTIIMVVLAGLSSVVGSAYVLLMFFPFLITIVLALGYDKATAVLATVGAVMVGFIGTTLAVSTQSIVEFLSLKENYLMGGKVLLLVLSLALLVVYTVLRGEKTKPKKIEVELPKADKKAKVWPIKIIFALLFLVFILAYTNWGGIFDKNIFVDLVEKLKSFTIGGKEIKFVGKLIGDAVVPFGQWEAPNAIYLLVIATGIVALIHSISLDEMLESYVEGMKAAVKPIVISLMIFIILIISVYHPFVLTSVKGLINSKLNVFTFGLAGIIANLFSVEIQYAGNAVLPYLVSVVTNGKALQVAGLMWQAIHGFSMIFLPTSVVLMVTLTYLELAYTKYIKAVWKFLLALFVLILVFSLVLKMIVI